MQDRSIDRRVSIGMHGDTHIANVYTTPDGPGFADWQLIKSANWARSGNGCGTVDESNVQALRYGR